MNLGCTNSSTNCSTNSKPNYIHIREWDSTPQSKGCLEYKGKYYVNLKDGNKDTPENGLRTGTYAVGSTDYCAVIQYYAGKSQSCPDANEFMDFFKNIERYSNCDEDRIFHCDEFIIFENKETGNLELHQSIISNNTRHPHDREAWKNLGDMDNILALIFSEADGHQLTFPYWQECKGVNCAALYMKDSCVVEKVANGRYDNCGNPLYDELIFQSLEDKNTDRPSLGAAKPTPTWDGPFTACEWVNRPVAQTLSGDIIKPTGGELPCLLACDEVEAELPIEITSLEKEDGSVVKLWKLLYDKGLEVVDGVLNAKLGLGLFFNSDKGIEVKPADNSISVTEDGVSVNQFAVDLDGNPIEWDSDNPPCLLECDSVAAEAPIVIEDTVVDGETVKVWKLLYDKGLTVVGGKLQALIDTAKGLYFNGDKIAINIGKALGFATDGKIDVQVDGQSVIINGNKLSTVCDELAFGFGTDSGNEDISGHYRYNFSKKNPVAEGGLVMLDDGSGFKIPEDGWYEVGWMMSVHHKSGVADNPDLFISVELNGEGLQNIATGGVGVDPIFSQRYILTDSGSGVLDGQNAREPRSRIINLKAGDELSVATQDGGSMGWPGFAGHTKGASDFWVREIRTKAAKCPN